MGGMTADHPHTKFAESRPHKSKGEVQARHELGAALRDSPIPTDELTGNLALYLDRKQLMDLLALDHLYRSIVQIPGVIMEFGVRWGRHLGAFTSLRALHEPYNVHRRVIGFDTFTGFPDVSPIDQANRHAHPGGLNVTPDYRNHLDRVLATLESTDPLGHVRRTFCLTGDVRETLPAYLAENPQTHVALAYFDLDLYEPTHDALNIIRPYLCTGSVLVFDQLGHAKWPGETLAVREVLGSDIPLETLPGYPGPVFVRWPPATNPSMNK